MAKTSAIIQARMGSTRLPEKIMKRLLGKTVLEHVILRVSKAKKIDEVIIATTIDEKDDAIVREAKRLGVVFYRGSEENVLARYYQAAKENNVDIVVRITSDCPLIDSNIIDGVIGFYKNNNYDIVTNAGINLEERTYPRGLDLEVFSFKILQNTYKKATKMHQREHVTPYIYETSSNIYYYKNEKNYSKHRWTLDTEEDWQLILKIYKHLYKGQHDFNYEDIIRVFDENPELIKINEHIEQKKL
ncbi:MAG: cytidylyltransferase domain-containing protein [Alkaliphilus sp.]